MREILFRAKQHYTKEWLYGAVVKDGDECLITVGEPDGLYKQKMTVVEESTVGQFTGITDKNGKKIFEGDIIQDGKDIVTVEWDEKFASWAWLKRGWMYKHSFGEAIDPKDCEVIGNIHDNKMEDIK